MSYITHRFRNVETLARAKDWLGVIGVSPDQIEVNSTGLPSMTIATDFGQMAEIDMIVNAVQMTDPKGWPSFDETSDQPFSLVEFSTASPHEAEIRTSPIGWHPVD